jgi:hypothetical protein
MQMPLANAVLGNGILHFLPQVKPPINRKVMKIPGKGKGFSHLPLFFFILFLF